MCACGLAGDRIGKHIAEVQGLIYGDPIIGRSQTPIQILGGLSPLETFISAASAIVLYVPAIGTL